MNEYMNIHENFKRLKFIILMQNKDEDGEEEEKE